MSDPKSLDQPQDEDFDEDVALKKPATCRHCGKEGLEWSFFHSIGWRLVGYDEAGNLLRHVCTPNKPTVHEMLRHIWKKLDRMEKKIDDIHNHYA